MQQRYQPTPTNIMHITLDLRCNKLFIKQQSDCMSGACLREKVSYHRGSHELDLTSSPLTETPSPTLDQHEHH
jgi:hypothetical protein